MVNPRYISAKRVFDFYLEKLQDDSTEQSRWALQYFNLQMLKYRGKATLNSLYNFPIEVSEVGENNG